MNTTTPLSSVDDVTRYLVERRLMSPTEVADVDMLSGGVSGDTFLIHRELGDDWVVKQARSALRVDSQWASDPRRIHREAAALRWLNHVLDGDATVRLIDEDFERHALVMEAVPAPHSTWKSLLLAGYIKTEHVRRFATMLAAMHLSGWQQRDELPEILGEGEYFEELRLEPYYRYTGEQIAECRDFLEALADATAARRDGFVHGDYSPKNVLIHPRPHGGDRIVLLDHEVAHVGDPAFDIGFSLAHFIGKANVRRDLAKQFGDAALLYWLTYAEITQGLRGEGEGFERRAVAHLLGCCLARAVGRSPLEYLDGAARERQRQIGVRMIRDFPTGIAAAISTFTEELNT